MTKLSASAVSAYRKTKLAEQGGRCALCGEEIEAGADVLDHDHSTGRVRAVLHRGCNAMLGHIENNRARNHLKGGRLWRMLRAAENYIGACYEANPFHPTHRTEEQKRERRNKLARNRRTAAKAAG